MYPLLVNEFYFQLLKFWKRGILCYLKRNIDNCLAFLSQQKRNKIATVCSVCWYMLHTALDPDKYHYHETTVLTECIMYDRYLVHGMGYFANSVLDISTKINNSFNFFKYFNQQYMYLCTQWCLNEWHSKFIFSMINSYGEIRHFKDMNKDLDMHVDIADDFIVTRFLLHACSDLLINDLGCGVHQRNGEVGHLFCFNYCYAVTKIGNMKWALASHKCLLYETLHLAALCLYTTIFSMSVHN